METFATIPSWPTPHNSKHRAVSDPTLLGFTHILFTRPGNASFFIRRPSMPNEWNTGVLPGSSDLRVLSKTTVLFTGIVRIPVDSTPFAYVKFQPKRKPVTSIYTQSPGRGLHSAGIVFRIFVTDNVPSINTPRMIEDSPI